MAVRALAPPFWEDIDRMPAKEQELNRAIRLAYGSALMNGPFAICVANENTLVGFTDRIKLRPLVTGELGTASISPARKQQSGGWNRMLKISPCQKPVNRS